MGGREPTRVWGVAGRRALRPLIMALRVGPVARVERQHCVALVQAHWCHAIQINLLTLFTDVNR